MILNRWDVTPKQAVQIQKSLGKHVKLEFPGHEINTIAGVDCSYKNGIATAVIVILSFPEMRQLEISVLRRPITFPYVPTLLSFREGPVVMECFKKVKVRPDCLIFDGQGIAHPRGMGLATHIGILLGIPTIGCAKSQLTGTRVFPGKDKGNYSRIKNKKGEVICIALRTRKNVKPVYVSPGHLMDFTHARKIVLACSKKYRIPEPVRVAHTVSTK